MCWCWPSLHQIYFDERWCVVVFAVAFLALIVLLVVVYARRKTPEEKERDWD